LLGLALKFSESPQGKASTLDWRQETTAKERLSKAHGKNHPALYVKAVFKTAYEARHAEHSSYPSE